jgi:hypothetical protein
LPIGRSNTIRSCALERDATKAHRFRGDQNPFRIHPVKNIFESATLLANSILDRNLKPINKQQI